MRRRDWAGTVLVPCLIALAGLLHDRQLFALLLLAAAAGSAGVVIWDVASARGYEGGRRATLVSGDRSLAEALAAASKAGRRLHAEAGELNPVGNLDGLDDLVRRCNEWEASVSNALAADDDIPPEWRDLWLRDPDWHNPQVYPYTREQLDRMVRLIGYRLQLIDGMRRDLRKGSV